MDLHFRVEKRGERFAVQYVRFDAFGQHAAIPQAKHMGECWCDFLVLAGWSVCPGYYCIILMSGSSNHTNTTLSSSLAAAYLLMAGISKLIEVRIKNKCLPSSTEYDDSKE